MLRFSIYSLSRFLLSCIECVRACVCAGFFSFSRHSLHIFVNLCHPRSLLVLSALFARYKQHLLDQFDSITCVLLHVRCIPNRKTTIPIILFFVRSFIHSTFIKLELSLANGTFNIMNEQFKCEIFHFKQFNSIVRGVLCDGVSKCFERWNGSVNWRRVYNIYYYICSTERFVRIGSFCIHKLW